MFAAKEASMSRSITKTAVAGSVVAVCLALSVPAFAGDSNQASLFQSGSNNSLFTNQSNASGSLLGVGTSPLGDTGPLTQVGIGNTAWIVVGTPGQGGQNGMGFLQQGSSATPFNNNTATLNILGADSVGSVTQNGNGNQATLTASDGAQGAISQTGDNNNAGLSVSGSGTNIIYNQNGSGLKTGGVITITSTSLPGTLPGNAASASGATAITITQTSN
jgi:hypothetical protein